MLRNIDLDTARTRFYGLYSGTVTDVEGPNGVGRISVNVPSVFDEDSPYFTVWARPCLPYGHFFIPEVGDQVWIAFEHGDPSSPV